MKTVLFNWRAFNGGLVMDRLEEPPISRRRMLLTGRIMIYRRVVRVAASTLEAFDDDLMRVRL